MFSIDQTIVGRGSDFNNRYFVVGVKIIRIYFSLSQNCNSLLIAVITYFIVAGELLDQFSLKQLETEY